MEPVERAASAGDWAEWRQTLLSDGDDLAVALELFEAHAVPWLPAVDAEGRLTGILHDGRLRLEILAGAAGDAPVRSLLEPPPLVLGPQGDAAHERELIERAGIEGAPRVDAGGRLVGVERLRDDGAHVGLRAVIMAGGLGRRLRPLTEETPKPMLRVAGRPLLEHTLPWLSGHGFRSITLCLHYKADHFRRHLGDGSRFGVEIDYVVEPERMGTAGALGLLPARPEGPILTLNGDLLTTVALDAMLRFHRAQGAEATMGVCRIDSQSRYGVVQLDGVRVTQVVEKPFTTSFVNAGIYVLEPTALDLLPSGRRFDMPDLFAAVAAAGRRTVAFPIFEYWIDIGWLNDLERATADLPTLTAGPSGRRFIGATDSPAAREKRFGVRPSA